MDPGTITDTPMTKLRDTRIVIDLARLERNYRRLRGAHARQRIVTVLKANAYGHGMAPAARFLQSLGQEMFAVALLEEGLELRRAGIKGRILVLAPPPAPVAAYSGDSADPADPVDSGDSADPSGYRVCLEYGFEPVIPSLHHLRQAAHIAGEAGATVPSGGPALKIHLKVDTGMGRVGLQWTEREQALAELDLARGLILQGVCSHFAESERMESDFCDSQLENFKAWRGLFLERARDDPPEFHLANSGGLLRDVRYHFDYARVGFSLWAPLMFDPPESQPPLNRELEHVMRLVTRISHVKTMGEGDSVGYSRAYRSQEGEVIATLPVGYGDGVFRSLGNRGFVEIAGRRCPIVGTVSMDQITVSLGRDFPDERARIGEEALLLGESLPAAEVAEWAGTIDYEVFTHLNARIPREYRYDGVRVPAP